MEQLYTQSKWLLSRFKELQKWLQPPRDLWSHVKKKEERKKSRKIDKNMLKQSFFYIQWFGPFLILHILQLQLIC